MTAIRRLPPLGACDDAVGREPKTIATYVRLRAAKAFCDGEYEISARLGAAATAINTDARNNHDPDWEHRALRRRCWC
jgi:hypothetical protein